MVVSGACFLAITGCYTPTFRPNGIPHDRFQLGGGMDVSFIAPEDGTIYYVELDKRKILLSDTISKGSTFNIKPNTAKRLIEETLAIEPADTNLVLYFVPF